jgi:hypothetical protein
VSETGPVVGELPRRVDVVVEVDDRGLVVLLRISRN